MTEHATLLAALLMPARAPHHARHARRGQASTGTRPFFRVEGLIGPKLAIAQWAGGRLHADGELRGAAERLAQCTLVDNDLSFQAGLRRRVDAVRDLLACFDEVTYAEIGLDVDASATRRRAAVQEEPSSAPPPDPVRPVRADACPVCASRATSFEYHAPDWCPSGSPTAHIHRRCSVCGHVWYEAP